MGVDRGGRADTDRLAKGRQWGGSTLTQVFISWVQRLVKSNWHAFVCTLTKGQAQHLRKMHKRIAASMTRHGIPTTMGSYEGSQHNIIMDETSSIIGVSSIENPDAIRGFALNMVHLSEVGLFPSTVHVNAESYVQAIIPTLSDAAWTMIIMESTAKGVGNFFHQQWQDAQKESSPYTPVFIPWHVVPKYARDVKEPAGFMDAMDDYDWFLWKEGATLEHINWYHYQLGIYKGDTKVMQNEYPTVPAEAFQSSGNRYFPLDIVQKRREHIMDPAFEGELVDGKLIEKKEGGLRIWHHPGEALPGVKKGTKYLDRYVAFADFGGTTEKADWSVLSIVDRAPTLTGGPVRLAARLRVHMRPDLYAWECVEVCRLYDNCMFIPEINRHSSERGDAIRGYEPEWSLTVIEEISEAYGNVYYRTSHGRGDKKQTLEIGFHTNASTKPMLINGLLVSLEENYLHRLRLDALRRARRFREEAGREAGGRGRPARRHRVIGCRDRGAAYKYLRASTNGESAGCRTQAKERRIRQLLSSKSFLLRRSSRNASRC